MSISNVTAAATSNVTATASQQSSKAAETTSSTAAASAAATSQSSSSNTAAVYEKSNKSGSHADEVAKKQGLDPAEIKRLLEESKKQTESLTNLVKNMFSKQAKSSAVASATAIPGDTALGSLLSKIQNGESITSVDAATQEQAKKDIAEGGYYSVEKTGDRILDFAKAFAGSDPEKLEKMRAAVEKGFEQAEKAWGDKLPQISQDTMAYVRKGFEDLLKGNSSASVATSAVAAQ